MILVRFRARAECARSLRSPPRGEPGRCRGQLEAILALGLLSGLVLGGIACQSLRPVRIASLPREASQLFARAQAALREAGSPRADDPRRTGAQEEARALAQQALAAAPDWVAPARLLDELARDELRGVEALAARREHLARDPQNASELYLVGRLEGREGEARFERAAECDPSLAWARHGLAFWADRRGDSRAAAAHARAALYRARDAWERSFFTSALARTLAKGGRREEALDLLAQRLAAPEIALGDSIALSVDWVEVALEDEEAAQAPEAYRGGLELLRDRDLTEAEVERVIARIRPLATRKDNGLLELSTVLGSRRSPARDRLRAEVMLASGPTPLALGLLERSLAGPHRREVSGPLLRAARFAAGEFAPAVERWLRDLPARLRDREGLPRDDRLARIVRCARAVAELGDWAPAGAGSGPRAGAAEAWFDFGEALLEAGWFREARALAGRLANADFDRALALEARAASGMQLLESLDELIRRVGSRSSRRAAAAAGIAEVEGEHARHFPAGRPDPAAAVRDLDGLLAAMGRLFGQARDLAAGRAEVDFARSFVSSPRLDYGPVGAVVHPGPAFSRTDERDGLGRAGALVPGIAPAMDAIGRFALLGELSGAGGPDGTVLSRVLIETRSGEHFAVPWSGVVAWCEGADVRSRAEHMGARISAAALHEGFWLDVDSVRGERNAYLALADEFSGPDAAARVEQALSVRGLALEQGGLEERRRERRRTGAVLGEASRVRLALLRDRAPSGSVLGELSLDELVEVTATHEEGHLVDRTRFLPLSKHWGRALVFLVESGFSPTRVAERLEYRAELAALCDSPDPRVPLAQILDSAETESRGPTAHAGGYADLLRDLIEVLDEETAQDPKDHPWVDPDRTLVHQLHRLPPETVRALSLRLARNLGLFR